MRIYRIKPGPAGDVGLFGSFACSLVGVDCPVCTQWGGGFRYPTVGCAEVAALGGNIGKFFEEGKGDGRRKQLASMTVAEYTSVKALLEPLLGPMRPVEPGTSFGPVTGELRGEVHDFTWNLSSMLFVRESVFNEINAAGFPLAGAQADLTFKTFRGRRWLKHEGPGEPLIELEVPPVARLVSSSYERCELCGRTQVGRRKMILDRAAFDPSIPLQCVYEGEYFVVTEAFREFIRGKGYSGVGLSVQKSD